MSEYDGQLVLMNLEQLQQNRGMILNGEDAITSIQIKLYDYNNSDEVRQAAASGISPGSRDRQYMGGQTGACCCQRWKWKRLF